MERKCVDKSWKVVYKYSVEINKRDKLICYIALINYIFFFSFTSSKTHFLPYRYIINVVSRNYIIDI